MPEPVRSIPRIVLATEVQTCFLCAEVRTENERLRVEVERLTRALQRDSYVMDPREPHRKR